jgi:AcrR family transcriptional regulator
MEPSSVQVWRRERPEPRRRAPSVERIVAHAIEIADAEGLAAVSMRRVAGDLGSGTASLYRYVTSRDELVELMVDAVQGEGDPPVPRGDWRADLTDTAHRLRSALLRHPWLGPELAGRPTLGPNSLRRTENALTAAAGLTDDIDLAAGVVGTVLAYVLGAVAGEIADLQAQRRTGLTEDQWRASVAPYLREIIAGGDHPQFARRVIEGADPSAAERFTFGLECVLDGVAARVSPPGR